MRKDPKVLRRKWKTFSPKEAETKLTECTKIRVVVLGTGNCTRVVLEYKFKVHVLVLGSNVLVLVLEP